MSNLYETDFVEWTQQTLKHLQERDIKNLDWGHLIEEVELLGISEKNAVDSYLEQLLIHLLLYQYWMPDRGYYTQGWENEIDEFRSQLERKLESKSLYNYFLSRLSKTYDSARRRATKKFVRAGLDAPNFPKECPYTVEQILDQDYFPD